MNEIDVISNKIKALNAADDQIDRLEEEGSASSDAADSMRNQNRSRRTDLRARREKLMQTGQGVTPVLSADEAKDLRAKVRRLQQENLAADALRQLLLEVLAFAAEQADPDRARTWRHVTGPATRAPDLALPVAIAAAALAFAALVSGRRS